MSVSNLIYKDAQAAVSSNMSLTDEGDTALIIAKGLSGTEGIHIEVKGDKEEWYRLFNGSGPLITAKNNWAQISGPCEFRIVKDATANPVSVAVVYAYGELKG